MDRPTTSALRPDIVHRAAWLAALSRPGRGISRIGWTFCAIDATEQSAGEDLCPACLAWPLCGTCPGPACKRANPDGDGRCTTCAST
ncbi:hypothetical protein [Streptomyces galilaeus]|uniref:hypothetical protein n=1 Tax=Streptomyces galilaeus TaxID=33899 RepID=UPI001E5474C2|nr:hypothetical protein [Streptomyces galilaeus]